MQLFPRMNTIRRTYPSRLAPEVLNACVALYTMIDENVRCDMVSLHEDVNLDYYGFIPFRRNVRNSIEAFYDLANLVYRKGYYELLWYFEKKKRKQGNTVPGAFDSDEALEKKLTAAGFEKYLKFNRLSLSAKGHLAMELRNKQADATGGLVIWDTLRKIISESNNIVHPNFFTPPLVANERSGKLTDLLTADCELLCWSYMILLEQFGFQQQAVIDGYSASYALTEVLQMIRSYPVLIYQYQ